MDQRVMNNVESFGGITKLPLPVDRVLAGAANLNEVVVIGYHDDGSIHIAMSEPELDRVVMLLELAKAYVVQQAMTTTPVYDGGRS
jgi:hypothetical protein